ncbi:DUF6438 domain-containing protein [Chryseobacterium sp. GP-SGM7]|uniref:DUF6438 domain-containing protein n=1 Tax=Chryseobacterium sp. GP-SGM7 TaxID=3411323 RepID=UPI003B94FBA5
MKNSFLIFILALLICGCSKEIPRFDKIIYKTTGCFGTCPTYYLEISSDKTIKLFAETVFKKETSIFDFKLDSTKMGYFKGQLDDHTFYKLNENVKKISGPDYKYYRDDIARDTPTVTLMIQRGGDKTCYETFNPTMEFQTDIVDFLNEICSAKLEKSDAFKTDNRFDCL